jgi:hypothetical protein
MVKKDCFKGKMVVLEIKLWRFCAFS